MLRKPTFSLLILGLALCLGSALMAAERDVIYRGADLWTTPADGLTAVDFLENPIPAGFFCSTSAPFAGRIAFRGEPLSETGELGNTDTIVERLDDAVFDHRGVARTRVQLRALSLVGMELLRTDCGLFRVTAGLDREQPITVMEIVRNGSIGGYFLAPIELNFKLSFWPVSQRRDFTSRAEAENDRNRDRTYRPLQLVQFFRLSSNPQAGWTFAPAEDGVRHQDEIRIDLDGDGSAEILPGTSNIAVGWWDAGGVPSRNNVYFNGATNEVQPILHNCHAVRAPSYDKIVKGGKR